MKKNNCSNRANEEYLVYMLVCRDGTFYTGITNDPIKRLDAHNNGTASKYTRARRPVAYIYMESAEDKSAALKRELEIKSLSRKQKIQLINGSTNLMKNTCVDF